MFVPDDYYATLGVPARADAAAIRLAYRALMRRYHPDVNASLDAATKAKDINEAYACLRDTVKRASYDRQRSVATSLRRTPRATPAAPSQRPVWNGPVTVAAAPRAGFRPSWWKAAGLGIATLLTAVTFTVTSATPPGGAAMAQATPHLVVVASPARADCRASNAASGRAGASCR